MGHRGGVGVCRRLGRDDSYGSGRGVARLRKGGKFCVECEEEEVLREGLLVGVTPGWGPGVPGSEGETVGTRVKTEGIGVGSRPREGPPRECPPGVVVGRHLPKKKTGTRTRVPSGSTLCPVYAKRPPLSLDGAAGRGAGSTTSEGGLRTGPSETFFGVNRCCPN